MLNGAALLRNSLHFSRPLATPCSAQVRRLATATPSSSRIGLAEELSRTKIVLKTYKPITPGIRHLKRPINEHLYKGRPLRFLTVAKRKNGGRNNQGRITVRHRGGGHKQRIRNVDFDRRTPGPHDVVRIEYDPGRSAHIALLRNRDTSCRPEQLWSYILAPLGLRAGDEVQSFRHGIPNGVVPGFVDTPTLRGAQLFGTAAEITAQTNAASIIVVKLTARTVRPGNVLPLRLIPSGTQIHNIALHPHQRARLVRSAGAFAVLVAHEDKGKYAHVRLQSGEVRKVLQDCYATVGRVSNPNWNLRNLGKAGRRRWLGWRPSVRGVAMNAVDHPHGGGRGKSKSNKQPVSIWGWHTKGKRTRKPGPLGPKNNNKMVISERPRTKEKLISPSASGRPS